MLPLIKTVLTPLSQGVLVPLGLTAAVSARDAAIQKKIFELDRTTLLFLNEDLNDIIK